MLAKHGTYATLSQAVMDRKHWKMASDTYGRWAHPMVLDDDDDGNL